MKHTHPHHKIVMDAVKKAADKLAVLSGQAVSPNELSDAVIEGNRNAFEHVMMALWSTPENEKYIGLTYCDCCKKYSLHAPLKPI